MSFSVRTEKNITFLKHVIRFLQLDIGRLFLRKVFSLLQNCICCSEDVIRHNYGGKLKIVDGASDRKHQVIRQPCEAANTNLCQNAKLKLDNAKLHDLKEFIRKLWNNFVSKSENCSETQATSWCDLKSWQKLSFYWTAIANQILEESPFDNFKYYYNRNRQDSNTKTNKADEQMLIMWYSMTDNQRLPFIMEALIAKVSHGKVDIHNEHEIQRVLLKLHDI